MRQSAADIDYGILDVAARIFATHGFAHTSVQQIADAVGYSKPGLLHRFGSKEAIYRAVMTEVTDTVEVIVDHVAALGGRDDRLPSVLELIVRRALDRPGMVQMVLAAFDPTSDQPGNERAQAAGYRLIDALDRPYSTSAERLRIVLAMDLIVTAAMTQHSNVDADLHVDETELVPMVVSLARQVLGPA